METRVVLHIGTMKSGTSFLQSALATNRGVLAEAGVEVVGGRRGPGKPATAQPHRAAEELLHGNRGTREWRAVVAEIRATSCPVAVVSSEFFSFLDPRGIRQVTEEFDDLDLTVVLAVRDQLTAVPAQWQSFTRNFGKASFSDYVRLIEGERILDRRSRAYKTFRRAQDVPEIVARWSVPGVDRLVTITVPPPGSPPDELWKRFAAAGRLPEADLALDGVADNQSLGYAACDYLRRANEYLGDLPGRRYRKTVRPMAVEALAPLRAQQGRPQLDRAAALAARNRNASLRQAISAPGLELVGSLADLPVDVDLAAYPDTVPPPPADQVLASAEAGLRYAAERAGRPAPAPSGDLTATVRESALLLKDAPMKRGGEKRAGAKRAGRKGGVG